MSNALIPSTGQVAHLQPGEDLELLRTNARRYEWLRERNIHVQGDTTRYQGAYLDVRVDTGLEHEFLAKGGEL